MIIFQNAGMIDIAAVTTMGVSVKSDTAIGYFGTGVKFAIATLLRHGCDITVYRGLEAFTFTADEIIVRGETFERVCMNGEPLGFTTMLGRNWEPWMAFRELASNCRDEGGSYWRGDDAEPLDGLTTVAVSGKPIMDVWADRQTVMLEDNASYANEHIEVRPGVSQYVYFRGVRIYKAPRPLSQTYNVMTDLELTEDRTAKDWYALEMALERGIGAMDDRAMLRRLLTVGDRFGEHHMNIPAYGQPQEAFREVAREIAMGGANEVNANPHAVAFARESAIKDMQPGDGVTLQPVQSMMLSKATEMLETGGFKIGEFPLIVCDTLGPNIHGMAKDGKIFLSMLPFQKGTREVAATLLEEFSHLKSGQADCTRGFQNWLFDQLLVRAENSSGQPF